jgi:hypothetical protein
MRKLLLMAFLAMLCLGVGAVLSCSSSGGDDDDSSSGDDDSGDDDDDCDVGNPLPTSECGSICNADMCNSPAYDCVSEGEDITVEECISECMANCQEGCVPANAQACFEAFTDCDTLYECMGIDPGS